MVMMGSEGMTMTALNKVSLEDWRRGEKGSEKPRRWESSQMHIEITKNDNSDSYWIFLE